MTTDLSLAQRVSNLFTGGDADLPLPMLTNSQDNLTTKDLWPFQDEYKPLLFDFLMERVSFDDPVYHVMMTYTVTSRFVERYFRAIDLNKKFFSSSEKAYAWPFGVLIFRDEGNLGIYAFNSIRGSNSSTDVRRLRVVNRSYELLLALQSGLDLLQQFRKTAPTWVLNRRVGAFYLNTGHDMMLEPLFSQLANSSHRSSRTSTVFNYWRANQIPGL